MNAILYFSPSCSNNYLHWCYRHLDNSSSKMHTVYLLILLSRVAMKKINTFCWTRSWVVFKFSLDLGTFSPKHLWKCFLCKNLYCVSNGPSLHTHTHKYFYLLMLLIFLFSCKSKKSCTCWWYRARTFLSVGYILKYCQFHIFCSFLSQKSSFLGMFWFYRDH